jgi:hypothetical protein
MNNEMENKNLPTAQEMSNDISWAFFWFPLPPPCCSVGVPFDWSGGVAVSSPLCSCTRSHPMSSCSQQWLGVLLWRLWRPSSRFGVVASWINSICNEKELLVKIKQQKH